MGIINFEEALKEQKIITDYNKLSERSNEVDLTKKGREVQDITLKLKNTLRANKDMCGLSAPQIGYYKRIICLKFGDEIRTFINPLIEGVEGYEMSLETCHSIPNKKFIRIRNSKIKITYQTPLAKIETVELIGMASKVMQHEIDHLDGLLLSDVGFEVDEQWDKASEKEKLEVINYYLDSIDLLSKEVDKQIETDEEAKMIKDGIRFINSVKDGTTKLERIPLTDKEKKVIEEYKKELLESEHNSWYYIKCSC